MKVMKFGGSSVGNPEIISKLKEIVDGSAAPCIVVVSAFKGVTDQLISLGQLATSPGKEYEADLEVILKRHYDMLSLVPEEKVNSVRYEVDKLLVKLTDRLKGINLLRELTPKSLDYLLSFGERLSATIISNILNNAVYFDIRSIIRTDSNHGNAVVNFAITNELIKKQLSKLEKTIVIPGFIGSTDSGITTTLGRGGSDYTAAIIAGAIEAEQLEIWTDVDGFMTADPRKVEKAYAVNYLTYAEAMELSHFGAKVIYTPSIHPVYTRNIPIVIKNTFNVDAPGTIIGGNYDHTNGLIKGISSIDNINLITLQGIGLVGVTGISMRLFGALAKSNINIIMITQASSEYSITFAVKPEDADRAVYAIHDEFLTEIELKKEIRINLERELSVIAIVGEKMKNTPGISAVLFGSLGRNGISVMATAQGSSELNISVVIKSFSLKKALNVIHEGFFLSNYKELHLFVVGTGTVGRSFLSQLAGQQAKLLEQHKLKINLVGVINTRKMVIEKQCLKPEYFAETMDKIGEKSNLDEFVDQIKNLNFRNSVFVDCTANDSIPNYYEELFDNYVSVVTANKVACSSSFAFYSLLKKKALEKNVRFAFETNVGAGLPIISTINDLIRSGDKIVKMEAVLSGTLNFIFNTISPDIPLSKAVRMAKEKGFSEPDPRIDLSGIDVLRKLLILSREAGYPLEKEDVKSEGFLPEKCFSGTLDDFWRELEQLDGEFEQKRKKLASQNLKWRYVAEFNEQKASVSLKVVDQNHPSFSLEGSNNILILNTERYLEHPMIIKGYGAGAEVTAAGVFADVIRIANV